MDFRLDRRRVVVLFKEPMALACDRAFADADDLVISAGTLAEAYLVAARAGFTATLESFLSRLQLEVVPVDAKTAKAVGRACERWGKGLHPAGLNFGDCFAYALASERNCPLLFIGNDFSQTDLVSALP
jgi:ribonuclease VapC